MGAPNYLKLVIDGDRNLSAPMAKRFAKACRLNEESTEYFQTLVAFNQANTDEERNELHDRLTRFSRFRSSQRLDLAQKEYHSSWYIPAIRELIACKNFEEDSGWIADTLWPKITKAQAKSALDVLLELQLVERDGRGRLRQSTRASGLHIRNYHTEMTQRAIGAMHDVPAAQRYISALTLSASEATLAEVKRRVLEFRQELVALCDADPSPTRIVQLNLQLFPLDSSAAAEIEPGKAPPPARHSTKQVATSLLRAARSRPPRTRAA